MLFYAGYTLNASRADVFYAAALENPNADLSLYDVNDMIEEINKAEGATIPLLMVWS